MYDYRKLTPAEREAVVRQRLEKGFPRHESPHPTRDRAYYFLMAACYEHLHHMRAQARRETVLEKLREQSERQGVTLRAWVNLPNHYHILAEVTAFDALGEFFRFVHGPTARLWNQADSRPGRKILYRYGDRAIRSARYYAVTLNYIHYNPVKHGWVASSYDWQESSVHWYEAYYGPDWLRALWRDYPVRDYAQDWDD